MNTTTNKLELMEAQCSLNTRPARNREIADTLGFSVVGRIELPLWYDSTADIAAWETLSLCVNE